MEKNDIREFLLDIRKLKNKIKFLEIEYTFLKKTIICQNYLTFNVKGVIYEYYYK